MKVSEACGGTVATIRLRAVDAPFGPAIARESEVLIFESKGIYFLKSQDHAHVVEGIKQADKAALADVASAGEGALCYVAQSPGARKSPTDGFEVTIEARRFVGSHQSAGGLTFLIDEKVAEDLKHTFRLSLTIADLAAWLADRITMPAAPGATGPDSARRIIVSADERQRQNAYRIYGHRIAVDVREVEDQLRIDRIAKGAQPRGLRLALFSGPVSFVDATTAGKLDGAVLGTLAAAVAGKDNYFRAWEQYQAIEAAELMRRARAFGAIRYESCSQPAEREWHFKLSNAHDLGERLAALGEFSRFEITASAEAPKWLATEVSSPESLPGQARDQFVGTIARYGFEPRPSLVIAPDDDGDDTPKPPEAGYLFLALGGESRRLKRRAEAATALQSGRCEMKQLGLLILGLPVPIGRHKRVSIDGPTLKPIVQDVFGEHGPTPKQHEALDAALNTPDICLVQGPPGTGKTKVITALSRCIAALDEEGGDPNHRILLSSEQHDAVENVAQRTEVYGLPSVKIGRRRGRKEEVAVDPAVEFAEKRAAQLRKGFREIPDAERLARARQQAVACVRMKALPAEQARRLGEIIATLGDLLPPSLASKAEARVAVLARPVTPADPESGELLVGAARGIRVDAASFRDDGPLQARKALLRLKDVLTPEERTLLERCKSIEADPAPAWIGELAPLRDALIDRLTAVGAPRTAELDEETRAILSEVLVFVATKMASGRAGTDAALAAFVSALESDHDAVRHALEHYTVVLASTLQQSASRAMMQARGIEEGRASFESVVVDEAARANPLDLFIALSAAKRRVVLVGDHRQLPHLLEPDVERKLAEGVQAKTVAAETVEAIQASLFETMWIRLQNLGQQDRVVRTVRLDAQFRMHPVLGDFVSKHFYEVHELGESVTSPRPAEDFVHPLLDYARDSRPVPAAWIDVPGDEGFEMPGASKSRRVEALRIAAEVHRLMDFAPELTFGVISFYREQVNEIGLAMVPRGLTERTGPERMNWKIAHAYRATSDAKGDRVERLRIGTVDAFQGKEFDVVFLSITRSNALPAANERHLRSKYGHLMLENRLCVALSRQHRLLIAVGDLGFVQDPRAQAALRPLQAFAELCGSAHGVIR